MQQNSNTTVKSLLPIPSSFLPQPYLPAIPPRLLFSCSVMSTSFWHHGLQHTSLPCPSPTARAYSNSCPLSRWCHPTNSSSAVPFSCLRSFPASASFLMSWLFASGGQNTEASASEPVLPINIQDWFPLGIDWLCNLKETTFERMT